MLELEPASPEVLALYFARATELMQAADVCGVPRFSDQLKRELGSHLSDFAAVSLVEVASRLGDFGNAIYLAEQSRAVARLLKKRSVEVPRGKRTNRGLLELVSRITPILLHYGVPLATSERSRLVLALRSIADEVSVAGDPRDELRRLSRIAKEQPRRDQEAYSKILLAAARAWGGQRL